MHKYTAQTKKAPLAPEDATLMAEAAEVEAIVAVEPTPAEQVVDRLREDRAQTAGEGPLQGRADRIADLARKVRTTGPASNPPTPHPNPSTRPSKTSASAAKPNTAPAPPPVPRPGNPSRTGSPNSARTNRPAPCPSNAVARLRAAQAEQAAEQSRPDTGRPGRGTGPEQGPRGPRL
ncbi:hypothetical protein [Arthrobacter sp. SD76]|uniref:hypothetical protein n=1 Tax=Arthrobacter sp. SD76 TaxID=3415007 RepID=UPI003C74BFCE